MVLLVVLIHILNYTYNIYNMYSHNYYYVFVLLLVRHGDAIYVIHLSFRIIGINESSATCARRTGYIVDPK